MQQKLIDIEDWEVLTPSGWQDFSGILVTENQPLIELDSGLICTPTHKVKRDGKWVDAQNLSHVDREPSIVYDLYDVKNGNEYYTGSEVSHNCSMLLLDEFAFVPDNTAEEFFASVYPTISSGKESKIAVISTPNGMNHFYKLTKDAEAGLNGFHLTKAVWSDVPGRDQKWADDQKSVLGESKFAQEMSCEFQGASNTLISGQKLKSIPIEKPMSASQTLRIYAEPVPGNQYVMNVDTARGTGNDYSAYTIINVTSLPYTVDAVYADNEVSPLIFPGLVMNMSKRYNNAAVLVETNDIGESVASTIYYDYEYEETVMTTDKGEISAFGGDKPGLRTTKKTKQVGCSVLKTLIENDQLIIRDADILYEISNFVLKGASYEAENGHDDLVMTLVLFAYLTSQPLMQELTNSSAKARILELRQQQAEDQMLPVGFMSDGTEKEIEVFNF